MEKKRKPSKSDIPDPAKKISFKDIDEVCKNFELKFKGEESLELFRAICSIYREHAEKLTNKNVNLSLPKNRPAVLRSELINRYRDREPDDDLIKDFKSHKGTIRQKLKEMIYLQDENKTSLNPKCLVIKSTTRSGGEESNYFVSIVPPKQAPTEEEATQSDIIGLFQKNLEGWKASNYLGQKALSKEDLIEIERKINISNLNDESIAYLTISAIFRHYEYERWWRNFQKNETVLWHMLNLLTQIYRKPFWRICFLLQCADPKLLAKCTALFPENEFAPEHLKQALQHIKNNTVKEFLLKSIEEKSFLIEPYATVLLREFRIFDCNKLIGS